MKLLKTILVAVDFDDRLGGVLAVAGMVAKKFGSEVILTHVVEAADESGQAPESTRNSTTARLGQMQQQLTASGVSVPQVACLCGKAAVEIAEAAERVGANLVILGAQGVAREHSFALETTMDKVLRWSPKPVLVLPPEPPFACANIICPTDFSPVSARGLTAAILLARAFRSKLQIMTVVAPSSGYFRLDPHRTEKAAAALQARISKATNELDEFLRRFDLQDVTWEKHVMSGDPAHEIVHRARSTRADLIVMGSVGHSGPPFVFMGSTADKVARQLPCSLLTVKRVQVLVPELAQKIADIHAAFEEGQALLTQGFCQEAIARFDQCLGIDSCCADAMEGKAEALDRLGHNKDADQCRELAERTRRQVWEQRVTASVRAEHPFFHRRGPYE
jgi:nucleotide-binding universal stress UspA family protein